MKRIASMAMVVATATLLFAAPAAKAQDCNDLNGTLVALQADLDDFLAGEWSGGGDPLWLKVPGQLSPSFTGFDHVGAGIRLDHQFALLHAIINNDPSVVQDLDPALIGQVQAAFAQNREHIKSKQLSLFQVRVRGTFILSISDTINITTGASASISGPLGINIDFDVPPLWTTETEEGLLDSAGVEDFFLDFGAAFMTIGDDASIDYFRGFMAQLLLGTVKIVVPLLLEELKVGDEYIGPVEIDIEPSPKVASWVLDPNDIPIVSFPGGQGCSSDAFANAGVAICIGSLVVEGTGTITNTRIDQTRVNTAASINDFLNFFTQADAGFAPLGNVISPSGEIPGVGDTNVNVYTAAGGNLQDWLTAIGAGGSISVNALTTNTVEVDFGMPVFGDTPIGAFIVSGPGQGTLTTNPINVTGSGNTRTLEWASTREGLDGEEITISIPPHPTLFCGGTALPMSASTTAIGEPPFVVTTNPPKGGSVAPGAFTQIQVNFNQTVTGVLPGDLTVNGDEAGSAVQGPATRWTFSGFPPQGLATGLPIELAAGNIQDLAGNAFEGDSWTYDIEDLMVTTVASVAVDDGSSTNVSPTPFTITFDEGAFGLEESDFIVTNGSVQNLTGTDGDAVWSFEILPAGDGEVIISLPKAAAVNNDGIRESQEVSFTYTFDSTDPVVTIDGLPLITQNSSPAFTGTVIDEDPATVVRVIVGGNTVNAVVTDADWALASGVLPGLPDGLYDVTAEGEDTAGNIGTTTVEDGLLIDTVPPVLLTVFPTSFPPPYLSLRFDLLFSEPVVGVSAVDIDLDVVGGGLIVDLVDVLPLDDGSTWRVQLAISGEGPGAIGMTVLDNGTIFDVAGLPLQGVPFTVPANYNLPEDITIGPIVPGDGDGDGDGEGGFPTAPPGSPIAGPLGLAALAAGIAVGGAVMIRRRRKS